MSGLILGAGLLFADAVPQVRDVLLRVSPKLIAFIAFDQQIAVGAAANVGLAAALGLVGARRARHSRATPRRCWSGARWASSSSACSSRSCGPG